MFLHILGAESMFTKGFFRMLSNDFNPSEHTFVGRYPDEAKYAEIDQCKIVQSRSPAMFFSLYKADHIIVHGLFNKAVILALFLQPWLVKKCNWVVFGADIYSHKKANPSFTDRLFEKMKMKIAPKFPYISTFSDGDWALVQEWYGAKGKNLKVSYPLAGCNKELVNELQSVQKSDDSIHIVIGNSATATNQHIEALDWLARFKDENIRIHLPLNYGLGDYKAYAKKVTDYAVKIFGEEKVVPLTEKLSGEEYLRYLNCMDVGLFNNNRQQAMGNITQAVLCGAKVYIRKDTNMWEHYRKLGCNLYDIEEIRQMKSVDELVEENPEQKKSNRLAMSARQDMGLKISIWKNIFDTMSGKSQERADKG
ncbi:MAG: TDP-N-acetylfucosamine:lipid II N-acetylfucosaminyltransferase [Ruminococcus flavefaciens]|nr:TDP-N-acetylfucosamine:lipid II N-acetylfucosaminyltransferase [Ruminococcus flavefaciens]MCM1230527.1 TDP-N-acetylfucosamine:lipid II N-acetylfucosaminyltransferase [Ruminococcus flavefaciens]